MREARSANANATAAIILRVSGEAISFLTALNMAFPPFRLTDYASPAHEDEAFSSVLIPSEREDSRTGDTMARRQGRITLRCRMKMRP
ncbi:hypothetical protein [Myxococcus vastator]|uniref:hypothetical protein n=1 Tax=Myxococcus vastator TaxID=2709664 RepID=UPI0013D64801|nr:hypothetical protein [Myxococcus vastator]